MNDETFVGTEQEYDKELKLETLLDSDNIAELLSEDDLIKIGNDVVTGYENDLASREQWEKDLENWTKLALQISEQKTYPWQGAANIKYPLLTTAAMQFAARAYPTLVPSNGQIVKCKITGFDQDGSKAERSQRISKHMSYQVIDEMEDWEEDMDKLLISLPICGTCFKKTYWDSAKQVNCSKLILPRYLVVNYNARSLEEAERITEIIFLSRRQVKERINKGLFRDIDLGDPTASTNIKPTALKNSMQQEATEDETTPYTILEQHTYLDLDGDGYTEPYIVTVDETTQKVLRILPRYDEETIQVGTKGNVMCIEPIEFYTKYGFIPNPDGGFYDIGFGRLLAPLNDSANTLINQLVDAGSLSNLQAGFIGKGLRIRMGESRFQPGEWKAVNATGDDIKKQIFPLPVREPSDVLFKLLDLLLKSGKELASVAEIFVGKMPGQNTPATTTMASIEQGMKVFTAVYKRIYRSLTKEFRKIYRLNRKYLNPQEYIAELGIEVSQNDYESTEKDILPAADPQAVSTQEKQMKAQAIMQIMQLGTVNPMAFTKLYLEAHEVMDAETYMMQPQPKTDPKVEAMQAKAQIDQQKAQSDMQIAQQKMQLEATSKEQELQHKAALNRMALESEQMQGMLKGREAAMRMQEAHAQHQMTMQHQAESNAQTLQQNEVAFKQQAKQKQQLPKEKKTK